MKPLVDSIYQTIKDFHFFKRAETVMVGVSGGGDSTVLLHVLNQLQSRLGIRLHVVHYNHRLRSSSKHDEDFVKGLAESLGLPISIGRRPQAVLKKKMSEDAARILRLEYFKQVAQEQHLNTIVLAHTQDDYAETVLMRLLRGSGLMGLGSIDVKSEREGLRIVRPMLSVSRCQVNEYLKKNKLKFCTDPTNIQTDYLRNRVRHKLLPLLHSEYNSNISGVLVDLGKIAQADYDLLLSQANVIFNTKIAKSKRSVSIPFNFFMKQHLSMQRMVLRLSYEFLTGHLYQLSFTHIQELEGQLEKSSFIIHWPYKISVKKSQNSLQIIKS